MPAAVTQRVYHGDQRLWREPIEEPKEQLERATVQEFEGVDRTTRLVIGASSNTDLPLLVKCLGFPHPSAKNRNGWISVKRAIRRALVTRSLRNDPVVYVDDDTRSKVVSSWTGSVVVCTTSHGFTTGDVVLIRRNGAGLWSLVTVATTGDPARFTPTVVAGTTFVTPANGDEVHLVEAYWLGMVLAGMEKVDEQGFYAKEVHYQFRGSGTYDYARTAAPTGYGF